MRKLKIIEHISLDGVIQHSADETDFPYGEWTVPYRTAAGRDLVSVAHGDQFDLLLGRRTYDMWSGFWPKAPGSPLADRLNAAKKFVVSSLRELTRANSNLSARRQRRRVCCSIRTMWLDLSGSNRSRMHIRLQCFNARALRVLLSLTLTTLALPDVVHAASAARGNRQYAHDVRTSVDCAAAARIAIPNVRITASLAVPVNDSLRALGQKAHCRIEAVVDVETHIVALLPDDWNGRFLMGGAGGYGGAVQNQFESTVHEGYATVGTDAGHTAFAGTAEWALHNDRLIEDYAHRAVHRSAEATKALIVAYYGRAPEHSYFIGCSNGGREALMEAQRYPADFDGIVAVAPIFNMVEWSAAAIRNVQLQYPTGSASTPVVTPAVLRLVSAKVTEACDAMDGVRDSILENPEACTFKLASLSSCANDIPADGCITRAQRAVLTAITTPLNVGGLRYPGWPYGDQADPMGWGMWIAGPIGDVMGLTTRNAPTLQGIASIEFFKFFVYGDSAWSYVGYDLARAARDGAKVAAVVSATNPDLSAFYARGGKLLLAHGWSDPGISARSTIEYFKAVQQRSPHANSFTRLFMMPGVLHCDGGSGCDDVDYAGVIRQWVENGDAPSRIVARKLDGAKVVRTHPLCAYPMTARYNGSGKTDDAASFVCR